MKVKIRHIIAHRVGNKQRGEGVGFSAKEIESSTVSDALIRLINKSFKGNDFYHFTTNLDLGTNPVYSFVRSIFEYPDEFIAQSKHIAKSLYESSVHPKTKAGELCVIYLSGVEYEDTVVDAISIIKSESHQEVLQFDWGEHGYVARKSTGISLSKIDRGALILNVNADEGYKIAVVDRVSNNSDVKYWKDTFLHIQSYNGAHHQTANLIEAGNEFVNTFIKDNQKLPRLEKAMIASRVKDVLLQSDMVSIPIKEYAKAVFRDDNLVDMFTEHVASSDKAGELDAEAVAIEKKAIAKRKNAVSTIRLDNNFELCVIGAEDRITKGYDPDAALNYYKLYYEVES